MNTMLLFQLTTDLGNIWLPISFVGGSLLFGFCFAIYLHYRRKRHHLEYPILMKEFVVALEKNDIDTIIEKGDKLIWNEDFSPEDRRFVYNELDSRVKDEPKLKQTWGYAHFKRFGTYPE